MFWKVWYNATRTAKCPSFGARYNYTAFAAQVDPGAMRTRSVIARRCDQARKRAELPSIFKNRICSWPRSSPTLRGRISS